MTQHKDIESLPYIEVTLKLYNVDVPFQIDEDGTQHYFMGFQHTGATVTNKHGAYMGEITSMVGTGSPFVKLADDKGTWFLPVDDLFMTVIDTAGAKDLFNKQPTEQELLNMQREQEETTGDAYDDLDETDFPENDTDGPYPIDWSSSTVMLGGYLEDLTEPHVRKWPNNEDIKRKVKVSISRYVGVGGKHYHISIEEEYNPVWNWDEGYWQKPFEDDEGKGRTDMDVWHDLYDDHAFVNGKFEGYSLRIHATEALDRVMGKYFPDHELVIDDYGQDGYAYYRYKHGE